MKKICFIFASGVIFFCLPYTIGYSQQEVSSQPEKSATKNDFDLQEKCAKAANDYFKKNKRPEYSFEDYSNHYNKRLNKCFILVQGMIMDEVMVVRDKYLLDVLENKVIADWGYVFSKKEKKSEVKSDCKFPDRVDRCECSEEEFLVFVKPYMEE